MNQPTGQSTAEKLSQKAATLQNGTTAPSVTPGAVAPATTTAVTQKEDGFEAFLKRNKNDFAMVLPKHVSIDRVMRIALSAVRRNPKLLACSLPSIAGGIMEATALGLEINSPLRQASLVPFKNSKTGTLDAQLIIEYRGYIDLFYNSGKVDTIYASEVYENDQFNIRYGTNEDLTHIPWHQCKQKEPGAIIGFYAYAKMKNNAYRFSYWPKAQVDAHRDEFSSGYNPKDPDCPWIKNYVAMGRKTLIRELEKFIPKSAEIRYATEADYKIVDPMNLDVPAVPLSPEMEIKQ